MVHYFDTSALTKLVIAEQETAALFRWIADTDPDSVACDLVRTELMRAVRRTAPDRATRAREVLESVTLTTVPTALFDAAGRLDPPALRSLDALHLAAALEWGDELESIVAYDDRLVDAAQAQGISTTTPC